MPQTDDAIEARRLYEQKTAALVGRRIVGVTYWDIHNYGTTPRSWDYGDWHHAVMGLEVETESGPLCILWTDTFFPYGVEVFREPLANHLMLGPDGPEGWRVEDHRHWRSRVGSPVLGTATFWEDIEVGPARRLGDNQLVSEPKTYTVPIALRLDFEAGPVWIVAAMPDWPDLERVFVPADEIMVVFSPARMRKIGFPKTDFLSAGPTF
ncbi:hypothetical protein EV643_1088 [Kribbella sp. VKM Ac-2527]|uniref:Uncharacterized protein n=1 Tax=Kribbella caucasensis TaxID=2512215 RepID=A0A4R6KBS1_9ACTN|nr:hypothetical protein [Kribbella sp. VKM Ac-2527]TDO47702.1 hypothetical protein EV643_1088 [Kribbella sp. VKM Ac-2527]